MTQPDGGSLDPGRILAGRYRIETFLGEGAVGEVYGAHDLELDESVAVKVLRPALAGDEGVLRRFRREIQLAHRVTHPNACRVFDLVQPAEEGSPRAFLTMERLAGETLADRIEREGPLPPAAALPLVRQIAAALGAAHARGVVHRDLKSSNILLVPETDGPRAVVTDFGLAGSLSGEKNAGGTLTATGELLGSPAYMAPEQVKGEEATPATDVYAFGVVLYEMVTGELPFVGASAFSTALKRLQEDPPPPRARVPGLDPVWNAVILRCLARDPAERFQQAHEVLDTLTGAAETAGAPPPPAAPLLGGEETVEIRLDEPRRPGWRTLLLGGAALAAAAALLLVAFPAGRPGPPPAPRRSVAVLRFDDLSSGKGRSAYLSDSLFQMLPTELAAHRDLRAIPVEEIDRATRDLGLAASASLSRENLRRLRLRLGADVVVTGAYLVTPAGETRFDLLAHDTASGEALAAFHETGTEAAFLATLGALGDRLSDELGEAALSPAEARAMERVRPASAEAARLYAEGLALLRGFEVRAAREPLQRAVDLEPGNPLFRSALGAAWAAAGYSGLAREEARRAFEASAPLRGEDRRLIEARYRETDGDWAAAIALYRGLVKDFPDEPEYGLRLAAAQISGGAPKDALATLDGLRRASPAAAADPRLDLAEAVAAQTQGDARRQLAAAARAETRAAAAGARSQVALARLAQGQAALDLGNPRKSLEDLATAARLAQELGDRLTQARALNTRGVALESQGDLAAAEELYRQAQEVFEEIGHDRGTAAAVNNRAVLAIRQGRLSTARRQLERALAGFQAVGDRSAAANALNNLGVIGQMEGDLALYRGRLAEALAIYVETGDQGSQARTLLNLADADFLGGDLAAADARLGQALKIYRALGNRSLTATAQQLQGAVLLQRGDLDGAGRIFREVRGIQSELGEKASVSDCDLDLANVALEEGDFRQAEEQAQSALAGFKAVGLQAREADALHTLARIALEQGRTAAARERLAAARKAAAAAGDNSNHRFELALDIAEARVQTAAGEARQAIPALEVALHDAQGAGLALPAMEARLALAEAEIAAGRGAAGRQRLADLEKDARARGFTLFARRAVRAR